MTTRPAHLSLLRTLLTHLLPASFHELVRVLTDLLRLLLLLLPALRRPRGLYEVLRVKASLELRDVRGRRALHLRQERVRFLRDQVTSLYQYGWGTGETFASHRVRPGRIAERRKIGPRYRSLVVLPEPQDRGSELTLEVRRLIRNGEWGRRNWLEVEVNQVTHRVELEVLLPAGRRVRAGRLLRNRGAGESVVAVRKLAEGKQRLYARVLRPAIGDRYTLEWEW